MPPCKRPERSPGPVAHPKGRPSLFAKQRGVTRPSKGAALREGAVLHCVGFGQLAFRSQHLEQTDRVAASGSRLGNGTDDIYGPTFQELIYSGNGS